MLEDALRDMRRANIRVSAIVPVHLYGHPADMPAIMQIAARYDIPVVEDGAQAHGARIGDRMVGTWGDLAAFSFYPTKNLGALGDGGSVVARSIESTNHVRALREYGWRQRYVSAEPGINSRLDELQAAVLRVKLAHLDEDNECRRSRARRYGELLRDTSVQIPSVAPGTTHVYHQYVARSVARDRLQSHLRAAQIVTLVHYPVPVHRQPAFQRDAHPGRLECTDAAAAAVLSLPMYPELPLDALSRIADSIRDFDRGAR